MYGKSSRSTQRAPGISGCSGLRKNPRHPLQKSQMPHRRVFAARVRELERPRRKRLAFEVPPRRPEAADITPPRNGRYKVDVVEHALLGQRLEQPEVECCAPDPTARERETEVIPVG